jgi:hypothetical protein
MTALVKPSLEDVGSVEWLLRTGGRLTRAERSFLLRGIFPMLREGFRLRRRAKKSDRHGASLGPFEPPATPMVRAAQEHLAAHSDRTMQNHCYRTAFWALTVLGHDAELSERDLETTWVAALLHDVGLEVPPTKGDFSLGGVEILETLAEKHRWSEEQAHDAAEAIAVNLSTRVDAARVGKVAWALNVGGTGELGIWPHRAQMHRQRISELEARYPRDGFRAFAMGLIREEERRVPDGRFALFKPVYWLLMR